MSVAVELPLARNSSSLLVVQERFDVSGHPAVVTEFSLDESFLLGTKEQLTDLAHAILRAVEGPFHESNWQGISVQQSLTDQSLTEPMSEVAIHGVTIVETNNDRRLLVNYFRTCNGEDPIDWQGHDRVQGEIPSNS